MIEMPRSWLSWRSEPRIVARSDASTIETGSSATIRCGRSSSARATMMRWRWPPLSWCGKRPRISSGRRPTARSASSIRPRAFGPRLGEAELRDRRRRAHGPPGRTDCRPRTGPGRSPGRRGGMRAARRRDRACRSLPRYSTWPAVGATSPSSSRASVVLPLPLSPTMAVIDGRSASIASEKSSSAMVLARSSNPPPNVLVT